MLVASVHGVTGLAFGHGVSLLLKRYFGLDTESDGPANNIVGPKETEIKFDKILGRDKPRTRATTDLQ
jgi:hypothetical protein